jgi:hypothetical protein
MAGYLVAAVGTTLQYFTDQGVVLAGGAVSTFVAGTSTPVATFTDSTLGVSNGTVITLTSAGRLPASCWVGTGTKIKMVLKDSGGNPIANGTVDQLSGIGDPASATATDLGKVLYPQTSAEIAASVTPVNYIYPPGVIDRYGNNSTPGTTDMLTAINAAISQCALTGGSQVIGLNTTYFHSAAITMKANVLLRGLGRTLTIFTSSHTGNGIATTSAINSVTGVSTEIRDCQFINSNASNTGGGIVDVGGTFVYIRAVTISGFKYSIIFDQSELADVDLCSFGAFLTGGVWLVNGADHTMGANSGYTNRISVKRCEFNGNAGGGGAAQGTGIIDDGGTCHHFEDNNLNLCVNHYRLAGGIDIKISASEHESSSGNNILMATTTSILGTSVGACNTVSIDDNFFSPAITGIVCALVATSIKVTGNRCITSAPCFTGSSGVNTIVAFSNYDSNIGVLFDGLGGNHFELNVVEGTTKFKNTTHAFTGAMTVTGAIGVNGNSAPAQVTGWGTPTGAAVQNNYSGGSATLAQTSAAVAKIITDLKALGLYGA